METGDGITDLITPTDIIITVITGIITEVVTTHILPVIMRIITDRAGITGVTGLYPQEAQQKGITILTIMLLTEGGEVFQQIEPVIIPGPLEKEEPL